MAEVVYLAIQNSNAPFEVKRKEKEYKRYVDNHINNVWKAWEDMKRNVDLMNYIYSITDKDNYYSSPKLNITIMNEIIIAHDVSKYGEFEWEAYRKNFFPVTEEEKEENKEDFEKAWEHHYMNNMHHWNYWSVTDQVDKMPLAFVVEMCCDWIAMSMVFRGDAYHWYKKQTDIVLGDVQKDWVENILTLYYKIEKE